jgi:hypothetical protein
MLMLPLLFVTATLGGASSAHGAASAGIPAWARRYNVNCSHCHEAAIPRLNSTGFRFRWAGYRMPEDLGQPVTVSQVTNYLAARAQIDYVWEKTDGQPTTASEFAEPALAILYAGPFGKNFGGWFELNREEGEVGASAAVTGVWGSEKNHGGFRVGNVPYYLEGGVAGFDRPIGIEAPTPAAGPVSSAIPFSFEGEQQAGELFYVTGNNRIAATLLNSNVFDGTALSQTGSTKKDVSLNDMLLIDEKGSGLYAAGYYGTVTGMDPAQASTNSHYWRLAFSANKYFGGVDGPNLEALGGVVYGQDLDLPVGAVFTRTDNKGYGYWFSGQYFFAKPALTVFGRFESVDPDTQTSSDGNQRFVFGMVLPVNLPEYLRLTAEWHMDKPQASGAPKTNAATAEVQVIF